MEAIGNSSLGTFNVLANVGATISEETATIVRMDLIIVDMVRCVAKAAVSIPAASVSAKSPACSRLNHMAEAKEWIRRFPATPALEKAGLRVERLTGRR